MLDHRFFTLAMEFDTLKKELENCTEPPVRKCLLGEMRVKLIEMDAMMKAHLAELSGQG